MDDIIHSFSCRVYTYWSEKYVSKTEIRVLIYVLKVIFTQCVTIVGPRRPKGYYIAHKAYTYTQTNCLCVSE